MCFCKVAYVEYVPYGQRRPEQRRGKHTRTNYGTLLHSLDDSYRLNEVAREMLATDTQRSESVSSDALLNDSESGSHKGDSSSSGDSDVVESHDYLGDEGPGCNAGTPEDLSTDDADYDESGVPEDERRAVPWLSELCREVYEGS